jgi:hypothetical protein
MHEFVNVCFTCDAKHVPTYIRLLIEKIETFNLLLVIVNQFFRQILQFPIDSME